MAAILAPVIADSDYTVLKLIVKQTLLLPQPGYISVLYSNYNLRSRPCLHCWYQVLWV